MLSLYAIMLLTLGFLLAALLLVVFLPAYRRRIERFTEQALKRALPLTEEEIRADKDRLRAAFAVDVHKLETKLEDARHSAARQSVEINRRDAKIQELNEAVAAHAITVAEHENARRVLEQAILDRLPKVEQRLTETRRLLAARDREIMHLTHTGAKQAAALEDAAQLNRQQAEELARAKMALDTRTTRNRDAAGKDHRFDGEVALRTEIEMLRSKSREQSALIERLQAVSDERDENVAARDEATRLKADLARTEAELTALRATGGSIAENEAENARQLAEAQSREQNNLAEIAKLRAALHAFETGATADLADKAEISALQAETAEQRRTIEALRVEIASAKERLARQAQHFHEELRRANEGVAKIAPPADLPQRLTLAERIVTPAKSPRAPEPVESPAAQAESVTQPFLKAVNDDGDTSAVARDVSSSAATDRGPELPPRRSRLLERISRIDKQA